MVNCWEFVEWLVVFAILWNREQGIGSREQ